MLSEVACVDMLYDMLYVIMLSCLYSEWGHSSHLLWLIRCRVGFEFAGGYALCAFAIMFTFWIRAVKSGVPAAAPFRGNVWCHSEGPVLVWGIGLCSDASIITLYTSGLPLPSPLWGQFLCLIKWPVLLLGYASCAWGRMITFYMNAVISHTVIVSAYSIGFSSCVLAAAPPWGSVLKLPCLQSTLYHSSHNFDWVTSYYRLVIRPINLAIVFWKW